ncbi:hypothetical protein NIES4075_00400 [Tolypothrix sp. NIES-4075]|nr:hypothetical protein NIES4075_00400 [Tolypothrix sp. NIES-4075]
MGRWGDGEKEELFFLSPCLPLPHSPYSLVFRYIASQNQYNADVLDWKIIG